MVSEPTRKFVRQRAKYLCEYCHSPEYLSPDRFTIDHIMPQSLGGSDDLDNLALACHRCNEPHYNFTVATDPKTQEQVPLFHPRQQQWSDHFIWTKDGIKILGTTATGRATSDRLLGSGSVSKTGFGCPPLGSMKKRKNSYAKPHQNYPQPRSNGR